MTQSIFHYLGTACAVTLFVASCSDAIEGVNNSAEQTDLICFGVSEGTTTRSVGEPKEALTAVLPLVDDTTSDSLYLNATVSDFPSVTTRAEMKTSSYTPESFEVLSMIQKTSTTSSDSEFYCFFNQTYKRDGDVYISDVSSGAKNYYWPGSDWSLDFYVVDKSTVDTITVDKDNRNYTFNYTVKENIAEQKDLLLATSKGISGAYNKSLPLTFQHACAAIRFKVSKLPEGYKVKSVKLANVKYKGTYHFDTSTWDLDNDSAGFELSSESEEGFDTTEGEITSDDNCFMMLPQSFAEEDVSPKVEIVIGKDGTNDRYYRALLKGTKWEGNKVYTYAISVEEAYEFKLEELEVEEYTVDAHYTILGIKLPEKESTYLKDDDKWTIKVVTEKGEESSDEYATILLEDEANQYIQFIKDGYWIDRILDKDGNDAGSARGETEVTGGLDDLYRYIYIMIPENTGSTSREIKLAVYIYDNQFKEYVITQLPAVDGWEQIDESTEDEFGFKWDRKANYMYTFTYYSSYRGSQFKEYCNQVINDNGASSYATVGDYTYKTYVTWFGYKYINSGNRLYIAIDYSKISLNKYEHTDDGWENTKQLKNILGSSIGTTFEDILTSITNSNGGKAFRLPENPNNSGYDETQDLALPSGSMSNNSAAIGECLKKNRYDLRKTTTTTVDEDGNSITQNGYIPVLKEDDIHWYLPSVAEFSSLPATGSLRDEITPSDCWSSNIDDSNTNNALIGDGTSVDRSAKYHVRAKRKQE